MIRSSLSLIPRGLLLLAAIGTPLLATAPAAAAPKSRTPLSRGGSTLAAPAVGVSLSALVRSCQRGQRVELRVGQRRLLARLPRAGVVRRSWGLRRGAGPVRWQYRLQGRRPGCPRRLAGASLEFVPRAASAAPAPAANAPAPPAGVAARPQGGTVRLGTAISWAALTQDSQYAANAARFGTWTPENELKMEALAPAKDLLGRPQFDFTVADALVDHARGQDRDVHGHTLVFKNQIPAWVHNANWTRDDLNAYLRNYIHTVVGRYRGRIGGWDVVNEPLRATGDIDSSTFWYRHLGPDYIAAAFRWAREADPGATLYLNEVLDVANPIAAGAYELVRQLRDQGVPIDGIGLQTHVRATESVLTEEAFFQTYKRFADLGLKVSVSEMDVDQTGTNEHLQAEVFGNAARACARIPACERFGVWGVTDRYSWLGADKAALPLDRDYRPKPAWSAITGGLGPRAPRA